MSVQSPRSGGVRTVRVDFAVQDPKLRLINGQFEDPKFWPRWSSGEANLGRHGAQRGTDDPGNFAHTQSLAAPLVLPAFSRQPDPIKFCLFDAVPYSTSMPCRWCCGCRRHRRLLRHGSPLFSLRCTFLPSCGIGNLLGNECPCVPGVGESRRHRFVALSECGIKHGRPSIQEAR
jgi:hypothetical protein